MLQDVNDYVGALQIGVSSSFDDNGLTPVPAKVQEAVQSSAVLRVTAMRAEGATCLSARQPDARNSSVAYFMVMQALRESFGGVMKFDSYRYGSGVRRKLVLSDSWPPARAVLVKLCW